MTQPTALLLRANLKQLRLPTMLAECDKLAREAAAQNEPYESYLLRLTELEVATRLANALAARIRAAAFPTAKDFDTYDFTALPSLPKQKMLELARGDWIEQRATTAAWSATPGPARPTSPRPLGWPRAGRASACASSPRPAW